MTNKGKSLFTHVIVNKCFRFRAFPKDSEITLLQLGVCNERPSQKANRSSLYLTAAGSVFVFGPASATFNSSQDSGASGTRPVASDPSPSQRSEGCKLGAYTGAVPVSQLQYYVAGQQDLRGGMTCTFRINANLPLFTSFSWAAGQYL
jgi:hypothetical protein